MAQTFKELPAPQFRRLLEIAGLISQPSNDLDILTLLDEAMGIALVDAETRHSMTARKQIRCALDAIAFNQSAALTDIREMARGPVTVPENLQKAIDARAELGDPVGADRLRRMTITNLALQRTEGARA